MDSKIDIKSVRLTNELPCSLLDLIRNPKTLSAGWSAKFETSKPLTYVELNYFAGYVLGDSTQENCYVQKAAHRAPCIGVRFGFVEDKRLVARGNLLHVPRGNASETFFEIQSVNYDNQLTRLYSAFSNAKKPFI